MAVLKSIKSGNFSDSTVWALVDPTSFLDTRSSTSTFGTFTSSAFSSTTATISGILLNLVTTTVAQSGTMRVDLANASSGAILGSTLINVNDLPQTNAIGALGWTYFPFSGGSVSVLSGTGYQIKVTCSVANSVSYYFITSSGNLSRGLVTTTTQSPVMGDILIINGDYSSAGVNSLYTVNMDLLSTGTTYYGLIYIDTEGKLSYPLSASTNYALRLSGNMFIRGGGLLEMGNSTNSIPSSSTASLELSGASIGGSSIYIQNGTLSAYGNKLTYNRAKLSASTVAGATSLITDVSTGWLNNDLIIVPSTIRSATPNTTIDVRNLSGNSIGNTLTVSALTSAHDGSLSTLVYADIGNFRRNVKIFGTSGVNVFQFIPSTYNSIIAMDSVEIYNVGGTSTNSAGYLLSSAISSGSTVITNCAIYNLTTFTYYFLVIPTSFSNTLYHPVNFNNNVLYGFNGYGIYDALASTNRPYSANTYCDNLFIRSPIRFLRLNFNMSGNTITSNTGYAIETTTSYGTTPQNFIPGGFDNIRMYSTAQALNMNNWYPDSDFTINNFVAFRNNFSALNFGLWGGANPNTTAGPGRTIFKNGIFFGNNNAGVVYGSPTNAPHLFDTCYFYAGATYTQTYGIFCNSSAVINADFLNCYFGIIPSSAGGGSSALGSNILTTGFIFKVNLYNAIFSGGTTFGIAVGSNTSYENYGLSSMNHNGVLNDHRLFTTYGNHLRDSTIFSGTSPSLRITPISSTYKGISTPQKIAVKLGTTCTVSVLVRKSVVGDGTAYNGRQPRLILRRNHLGGIYSDVLLASGTTSNGVWETLVGTTPSVTNDCVLEFYVDCDGTTGWINVDNWSTTTANDTRELGYWFEGQPYVEIDYVTGGTTTVGSSGGSWTFIG